MIYAIKSILYKFFLILRGAKVGKNFKCFNFPLLESNNYILNLIIGDNVTFRWNVEIFFRNSGSIKISDNVKIDTNVRLLVANKANLNIGHGSNIGKNTIINAGDNISIGKNCLISANCLFQSSSHVYKSKKNIKNSGYKHKPVKLYGDNWVGAGSIILSGSSIEKGSIIPALSKINSKVKKNYIFYGKRSKKNRSRFNEL
jgi:acetyltransferase-like isoleucine patch superfamily enzyme